MKITYKTLAIIITSILILTTTAFAEFYCVKENTAPPVNCFEDEIAVYTGSYWSCASAPVTLANCSAEQRPISNGVSWECEATPTLPTCDPNQTIIFTATGYDCINLSNILWKE